MTAAHLAIEAAFCFAGFLAAVVTMFNREWRL